MEEIYDEKIDKHHDSAEILQQKKELIENEINNAELNIKNLEEEKLNKNNPNEIKNIMNEIKNEEIKQENLLIEMKMTNIRLKNVVLAKTKFENAAKKYFKKSFINRKNKKEEENYLASVKKAEKLQAVDDAQKKVELLTEKIEINQENIM